MSAETQVFDILSNDAGVAALALGGIHYKYVPYVPDIVLPPAIAYKRSATEYTNTIHTGVPVTGAVDIDIACVAASDQGAETLADAVVANPDLLKTNRFVDYDPDTKRHVTIITVQIWEDSAP